MSYVKQTWRPSDIITADKLNHIEEGISLISGIKVLKPTIDEDQGIIYLNLTFSELFELVSAGYLIGTYVTYSGGVNFILVLFINSQESLVVFRGRNGTLQFYDRGDGKGLQYSDQSSNSNS